MAGIAGCLALAGGTRPDADWVLRAVRRMAHRGPDDEHVISDGPVALAARRLAVMDPSAAGRQPMRSADGRYVIVYNGEIYNHAELSHRLRARGVALRGGSDTEVLLETYAAEGKEALRKLRGMFAFAIWDAAEFLARLAAPVVFPKRLGRPDEFGQLVRSLIENDYMNAEVVRFDGGIRFQPK